MELIATRNRKVTVMALSTIALNLKNAFSFQPKQLEESDISSAYNQRSQLDQPKLLFQMNTSPVENGIKSSSLVEELYTYQLAANLGLSSTIETTIGTDIFGNQGALILELRQSIGAIGRLYMRPDRITISAVPILFITAVSQESVFLNKRETLFQNRTLLLTRAGDTYNVPVVGDSPPATPNGMLEFDYVNQRLVRNNFTGIDVNTIACQGIVSFQNYVVLFNRSTIFFSNPLNFKEFTPAIGGAGSTKIAEARGDIITIIPSPNGLMIYCRSNIVHAAFTGDSTNPWVFTEVPNSSGLMLSDTISSPRPLVTFNEQSQTHYAMLTGGFSTVSESGVVLMPETVREFAMSGYVTTKVEGKSRLVRTLVEPASARINKMGGLYVFGNFLFMILGDSSFERPTDRLLILDTQTNAFGTVRGTFAGMHQRVTFNTATASAVSLQEQSTLVPGSFTLVRRPSDATPDPDKLEAMLFDVGNLGNTEIPLSTPEETTMISEVLVGNISISPDRNTVLHAIKLTGRLTRLTTDEGGLGPGVDPDTVKVFAFSESTQTADTAFEFTYNPVDNTYYGYMEGKDIRVLIQGKYFYLTKFEAQVEDGGII